MTRLQVGMKVIVGNELYRVDLVNDCRARCVPLRKQRVVIKDKVFNRTREFMATRKAINISPNSEVPIVS